MTFVPYFSRYLSIQIECFDRHISYRLCVDMLPSLSLEVSGLPSCLDGMKSHFFHTTFRCFCTPLPSQTSNNVQQRCSPIAPNHSGDMVVSVSESKYCSIRLRREWYVLIFFFHFAIFFRRQQTFSTSAFALIV